MLVFVGTQSAVDFTLQSTTPAPPSPKLSRKPEVSSQTFSPPSFPPSSSSSSLSSDGPSFEARPHVPSLHALAPSSKCHKLAHKPGCRDLRSTCKSEDSPGESRLEVVRNLCASPTPSVTEFYRHKSLPPPPLPKKSSKRQ